MALGYLCFIRRYWRLMGPFSPLTSAFRKRLAPGEKASTYPDYRIRNKAHQALGERWRLLYKMAGGGGLGDLIYLDAFLWCGRGIVSVHGNGPLQAALDTEGTVDTFEGVVVDLTLLLIHHDG